MKASELRKIYISAISLYGYILSKDLFKLLDHYQIKYKKEQIYKDLEERIFKHSKSYYVEKIKKNNYLIINPFIEPEDYWTLKEEKEGKPFYYPKTYEEFLNIGDSIFIDENEEKALIEISASLRRNTNCKDKNDYVVAMLIIASFRNSIGGTGFNGVSKVFETFDVRVNDEKSIMKLMKVIQKHVNNIRHIANNGFTPTELLKMEGPIDINNIAVSIGPNMRQSFFDGTNDPFEYLKEVEESDIPLMAKESIKAQLIEIIKEIEKIPKA